MFCTRGGTQIRTDTSNICSIAGIAPAARFLFKTIHAMAEVELQTGLEEPVVRRMEMGLKKGVDNLRLFCCVLHRTVTMWDVNSTLVISRSFDCDGHI